MKSKKSSALDLVKLCCRVLDERKAGDLKVLDVAAQSSITDFLVLATATSEAHLRSLRVELEKVLDAAKTHIVGMENIQESGWLVVDAFDVMIHLFLPAMRDRYGLERLWSDATEVSVVKLLAMPKRRRSPARRPAAPTKKRPRKGK
jgi:ribosome-associated protein